MKVSLFIIIITLVTATLQRSLSQDEQDKQLASNFRNEGTFSSFMAILARIFKEMVPKKQALDNQEFDLS